MSMTSTVPTLVTDRLVMRLPGAEDFDAYARFCQSERTAGVGGKMDRNAAFWTLAGTIDHWQLHGYGRWLVADRQSGEPYGIVGPHHPVDWSQPEIAWTLFDGAEGQGIAYEAVCAARAYAYDTLGWNTAVSHTSPDNTRSIALAKRLGATRDGNCELPGYGPLLVWRHPSPSDLAAEGAA